MTPGTGDGTPRLDHVAIAVERAQPVLDQLCGELGGEIVHGGQGPPFRAVHVRLGPADAGVKVELLERNEPDSFLARFLDRHGEGPHHLNFKVEDLAAEHDRLVAAGWQPWGVRLDHPLHNELFLRPAEAFGTVIQLVQQPDDDEFYEIAEEVVPGAHDQWWDQPPRGRGTVTLERVVLRAADLDRARGLLGGLLRGTRVEDASGAVEFTWPGGAVRVEAGPPGGGIERLEGRWTDGAGAGQLLLAGARLCLSGSEGETLSRPAARS